MEINKQGGNKKVVQIRNRTEKTGMPVVNIFIVEESTYSVIESYKCDQRKDKIFFHTYDQGWTPAATHKILKILKESYCILRENILKIKIKVAVTKMRTTDSN